MHLNLHPQHRNNSKHSSDTQYINNKHTTKMLLVPTIFSGKKSRVGEIYNFVAYAWKHIGVELKTVYE